MYHNSLAIKPDYNMIFAKLLKKAVC